MDVLVKILGLLFSLTILIIVHEMGHFLFSKLFKTRVEKFYLFFNPWFSLFKIKRGGTEYGIGWLPLGGYVKIAGMIDESMDKKQLKQEPQSWEFRAKPTWQRLLIMLGGVMFNFILAMFIYAMILYTWGKEYVPAENAVHGIYCDSLALEAGLQQGDKVLYVDTYRVEHLQDVRLHILLDNGKSITVKRDGETKKIEIPENFHKKLLENDRSLFIDFRFPFIIDSVLPDSGADRAGLKKNDRITAVNGIETPSFYEYAEIIKNFKGETVELNIERNNREKEVKVQLDSTGKIWAIARPISEIYETVKVNYSFFESFPAGIKEGVNKLVFYVRQFKLIFTKEGVEKVGSFITIGSIYPGIWDWQSIWALTALLSIILAFMNILPIPALDGGHVLFVLYEMITGRKPGDKFMEYAQIAGMIILIAILVFALKNDIFRLID